jgi:hypothetical protein
MLSVVVTATINPMGAINLLIWLNLAPSISIKVLGRTAGFGSLHLADQEIPAVAKMSLKHGTQTAGHLAIRQFPIALVSATVRSVRDQLWPSKYDVDLVVVTDLDGRYQGVAELKQLIRARDDLADFDLPQMLPVSIPV